jgi:glycosyltransferase involved in cell wall biosynthesis
MTAARKNERIPVLLMARELDQGGVERDVAKMAVHLDSARFETHVASYCDWGMRYEELRGAGVPFLHLPTLKPLSRDGFRAALLLRRYIREHAIRVVHAYDVSGILGQPAAQAAGVPVVIGSQLSYRNILDARTQWLLRLADPYCDAMVVNCEAMRRHMIEDERFPAARVELCFNGVETDRFCPGESPRPEEFAGASLVVGTVCALRPEKGLLLLQEGFARARKPGGVKLAIVGSGPELPALQDNAARLGIAGDSIFIPAVRDVPLWLRAIDIFVLPSFSEAFSNSLLEAMACGCASIGSRVGGTPELTGEDERGLLFRSGDAADLATRLTLLIADAALRRRLGERAARFARENLSMEVAARRTAAIYEKLLSHKAPAIAAAASAGK